MTGSTTVELASVLHARDLPGLAPMDHDLIRAQERAASPRDDLLNLPKGVCSEQRTQRDCSETVLPLASCIGHQAFSHHYSDRVWGG